MSPDLASPLSRDESQKAGQRAGLLSVGHAVPPHRMLQSDAAAAARRIFAHRYAAFERMAPVFETAGIRTRHTVKPIDWYLTDLGWPERKSGRSVILGGSSPRRSRCQPAQSGSGRTAPTTAVAAPLQ